MKKKEDQLREAFHLLVLRVAELIDQESLSASTISTICKGVQNFTLDNQVKLYQELLKLLETEKTEQEILNKGLAVRDTLLR